MTKEKLVEQLDRWLRGRVDVNGKVDGHGSLGALTDIKKSYHADVGTFILGSCFIDAMASFRYGVTKSILKDRKSGERYKNFVKEYLPRYNEDDLYLSLRCGLVHNYVEHYGRYLLDSNDYSANLHLQPEGDRIWINRQKFVDDLESAYNNFRAHVLSDDKVFALAVNRLNSLGLMKISE